MRSLGFISKQMYSTQTKKIKSPHDLKDYDVPLDSIGVFDIGREVFLNDDNIVILEVPSKKRKRVFELYKIEKIDNKPIINIDTNGDSYNAK